MRPKSNQKDLSELIKGSGIASASKFLNLGFKYAYTFFVTKFLGAEQFGLFVLGRSVVQMLGLIGSVGFGLSLTRHIPTFIKDSPNRVNHIFRISLSVSFTFSVLLSIGLFFASNWVANSLFSEPRLEWILKTFSIGIPVLSLLQLFYGALTGLKMVAIRVVAENILLPVVNILMIGVAYVLDLSITGITIGFIIAHSGALFFFMEVQ